MDHRWALGSSRWRCQGCWQEDCCLCLGAELWACRSHCASCISPPALMAGSPPPPTHPRARARARMHARKHANPDHPAQLLKPQLLLHRAPLPAARSQHTGMGSAPTTGTNTTAAPSSPAYPAASASPGTSPAGHSMDGGPGGMGCLNGMGGGRGFAKPIDPTYTARTFSQWVNGLDEDDPMILVCFMAAVASGAGCCTWRRCRLPGTPPPACGLCIGCCWWWCCGSGSGQPAAPTTRCRLLTAPPPRLPCSARVCAPELALGMGLWRRHQRPAPQKEDALTAKRGCTEPQDFVALLPRRPRELWQKYCERAGPKSSVVPAANVFKSMPLPAEEILSSARLIYIGSSPPPSPVRHYQIVAWRAPSS